MPPGPSSVRFARLAASGVASLASLDLDAIEDVRIAVDEICSALVEVGSCSPLQLRFSWSPAAFEVQGRTTSDGAAPDVERLELSRLILDAVTDDHELVVGGGHVHVWARKSLLAGARR